MNLRVAEKQEIYKRKSYPLLYLVKEPDGGREKENVVYSNSGLFYIFVIVIIFACLGVLLNIGLKIQSINYQKSIYEINEMVSLEDERSDRLLLEISELKSPSRIIEAARNDLGMDMTDNLKIVEISNSGLENNEKIYNYISGNTDTLAKNYDSFLGAIYYIQDIVLVVSESVLTFFIP
ncbi:MAG TPA: cell division protein FtsL [Candidatus Hydromicrobium sp.]